ncbi:MAG: lipopolysaccharide heptosyltransferase II [Oculatellaceae cyanobacterium Prado106]|jgi:lipopolysaccharide heptosyltransferase II|nr:lipopolysaccharide heptosyltransferase II [Oculatellaceae cyanobacterium Prado106]
MQDWQTAENILCIRLDSIGDVVMTTPAIRALKQALPGRRITLMTSTAGSAIAPLISDLDALIVYDAPWLKATEQRQNPDRDRQMIAKLQQENFDAAVIFTVYSQNPLPTALLCYWADIPLRLAHCHENPYQLLTDWIKDPEPEQFIRHEVQRQLDLVASVGCAIADPSLRLQVSPLTQNRVRQILIQNSVDLNRPWIVLHPGSTAPSRRYPAELYAIAAQKLTQDYDVQIVLTGTPPEQSLIDLIQQEMAAPSISLINQLNLPELAALLSLTPLLLSNNTGPVHIAAAFNTPIVDLYALTNPQHTPWNVPHRVLFHDVPCRYCYRSICPQDHHHCLQLVPPETVVEAVVELAGWKKLVALGNGGWGVGSREIL